MKKCDKGHDRDYHEALDVYFCKECDIWLEKQCGDPNCHFCPQRPKKPSEVYDYNDY